MRLERTMKRTFLSSLVLGPALLLAALLVPGTAAAAGPITTTACTAVGTDVTCNLWAESGTLSLPGTSVPIWGFSDTSGGSPIVPGPVLVVNQGDVVTVNLTNNLAQPTSILFGGQAMVPDQSGVAGGGGTHAYTFTASSPGTYLYEAGLIPGSQYQLAMGMYGVLVVRPTGRPGQAYGDAATAFNDEALVVLSEIDPALNNSATPWTVDLRAFAPKYFLVNGMAYTSAAPSITTTSGNTLLLRYANAGIQHHSIGVLGLHQRVLAADGSQLPHPRTMVAETIAPGQSADVLVTMPATTAASTRYALYDASLALNNSSASAIGGMLAFIDAAGTAGADTVGPLISAVALNLMTGDLTASVSDATTGNANVTAAEYFIDTTGAAGTGTAMGGSFGSPTVAVSATIPAPVIDALSSGSHSVYVRGEDSLGNWGALSSTTFSIDKTGPTTSALVLNPNPSNGLVTVALSGTASDAATGNGNVVAAEYFIGTPGADGTGGVVTRNMTAPTVSLSATIPAGQSGVVSVHAQDAAGNWGPFATITLTIDNAGPATSGVAASPNPSGNRLVRVTATFDDTASGGSTIATGEGFIGTAGANGTGFPFVATDGVFNEVNDPGYADIPLTTINQLPVGPNTIYVHGKDAAGNWGATSTITLDIERTLPAILSITRVDPSPTTAASVAFLVTFSESVTGVTSGNFALVSGGGLTGASITSVTGTGATRTVTATTGSAGGTVGLNLASATGITDLAGNALPTTGLPFVGQVYTVVTPLYFSTVGNTNPPGVTGTADDADIYLWDGSAFSRATDVTGITNPVPAGANVDGFDRIDATHFYMSFSGNVTLPGLGTVQDEDVVFYNAGTWSVYFDGTPATRGLSGSDLDAISIVGGTLYFSTDDTDVPVGVAGGGDDADIYSWNGTSFARVFDASALGWSTTNVDGFVRVDATHFYVSYSADTTVPVLGAVQDEDVVYHNAGAWSVYFDGTSKGLTSANLDVDAFDLP